MYDCLRVARRSPVKKNNNNNNIILRLHVHRHHAVPVVVGCVHVVRVHRRRSSELHADVGPGQEERSRIGRVQVHGHAHLHIQAGAGKRRV